MKTSGAKFVDSIVRFASVLAALIIGVAFVMVTSVNAAEPGKKIEVKDIKDKAKIEKIEKVLKAEKVDKLDSRAKLNNARLNNIRFNNLDNVKLNNNRVFFNRGLFINDDDLD